MNKFKLITSIILLSMFIISCTDSTSGGETLNEKVALYMPDGITPAINAIIQFYEIGDTSTAPTHQTQTDNNGRYSIEGVTSGSGYYNVIAEFNDSLFTMQDTIFISSESHFVKDDTLNNPGSISGIVALQPNHSHLLDNVYVIALGMGRAVNVDSTGWFTLSKLPQGDYDLQVDTEIENYGPKFVSTTITSSVNDTIADTITLPYRGIPVVTDISSTYDTLIGIATISWNKSSYGDISNYLIFRKLSDSLFFPSDPIGWVSSSFTSYNDTLFYSPVTDTQTKYYDYAVAILDSGTIPGPIHNYVQDTAVSPLKVKSSFEYQCFHIKKGFITDEASVNDSLRFTFTHSNQYRFISNIIYKDLDNDSIIKIKTSDSSNNIADTIIYSWNSLGNKSIEVSIKDNGDNVCVDTILISIIPDLPKLVFNDSTAYLNVPLSITASDIYGTIKSINIDTSNAISYQIISDSALSLIIHDTLNDSFPLSVTIQDDDNNIVKDTFYLSTGLKWEKIADNFIDTAKIRNVVELNNTLYALTYSKTPYGTKSNLSSIEYYIFSSSDGINWAKIFDSIPWKNWTTKLVVHNDKIFLIESIIDTSDTNTIWHTTDCINWLSKKLETLPKWLPYGNFDKLTYQEIVFHSHLSNIIYGSGHYLLPDSSFSVFYNSADGLTWTKGSDEQKLPYTSWIDGAPAQYISANNEFWYIQDQGYIYATINKTSDFINKQIIHTIQPSTFDNESGGNVKPPTPVFFKNKIFLCSTKETMYGNITAYLDENMTSQSRFTYPGSYYHDCINYNGKLLSVSNNGVFVTK